MKNKVTFPMFIISTIILTVFVFVVCINIINKYKSNLYYLKPGDNLNAKIESLKIVDSELIIKTKGNPIEYCVKTTKTIPESNAICWHEINDNYAKIGILKQKKYYIWIKDNNGNISNSEIIQPTN